MTRKILIFLNFFNVLSCIIGWVWLIPMDAEGMSVEILRPGTFDSFVIPAWILLIVVGGLYLVAAVTLLKRTAYGVLFSAVAGFAMIIWIYVEVVMLYDSGWAHHFWGATGIAELVCAFILLGILEKNSAESS